MSMVVKRNDYYIVWKPAFHDCTPKSLVRYRGKNDRRKAVIYVPMRASDVRIDLTNFAADLWPKMTSVHLLGKRGHCISHQVVLHESGTSISSNSLYLLPNRTSTKAINNKYKESKTYH